VDIVFNGQQVFRKRQTAAALAFLFFPSVVFWSSGLVKETLALAGIFWMSTIFLRFLKGEKISVFSLSSAFSVLDSVEPEILLGCFVSGCGGYILYRSPAAERFTLALIFLVVGLESVVCFDLYNGQSGSP
jgi:hypothetical protein